MPEHLPRRHAPALRVDVQVRAADAAPQDPQQGVARRRIGDGALLEAQRPDAAVHEHSGEPVNRAKVDLRVEGEHLVITLDPAWFMDSRRSFPITVDPTYAAAANSAPTDRIWVIAAKVSTDPPASVR